MASPAAKAVEPPKTLPPDFFDKQGAQDTLPANFDFGDKTPDQPQGNALQRAFDTATTVTPEQEKGHSWLTNKAQEFGAGAMQGIGQPFVHPLDTAEGVLNTIAHPIDTAKSTWAEAKEHPAKMLGNLVGGGVLGGAAGEIAGPIAERIPTRAKAGAVFQDLNKTLANQPVSLTNTTPALQRLAEIDATGPSMPTTANKLLNRSQMISPMNYPEARLFQENLSNPSVLEKQGMGGSMKGAIKQLKPAFYQDIRDAAEQQGRGGDFDKAMRDYRIASMTRDAAKKVGKAAAYGAAGAAGAGAGYRLAKDLIQ